MLLSVFVVAVLALTSDVTVNGAPSNAKLLPRVLEAVQRALKFFSDDFGDINVDGLFGLRLGQGQIIAALQECEKKNCPPELLESLRRLHQDLDETCKKAMPYIESASPDYFERFMDAIATPYKLNYRPMKFKNMKDAKIGESDDYDEEEGDRCYARLLGSYKENGRRLPKCNVTQPCLDYMTKSNTKRYAITHQLLYFVVVAHTGCDKHLASYDHRLSMDGIREIEDRLCRVIYKEATHLAKKNHVGVGNQDLFLEQTVICGSLGYEDFLKPDYIEMVLRMQAREGCFKIGMDEDPVLANLLEMKLRRGRTSRHLLREQKMKDGCLSHKSGLGFGTLALYLRYLVRSVV